MSQENPALPPDPALLNRQPKWFKKVFYGVIVASILFMIALVVLLFAPMFVRVNRNAVVLHIDNSVRTYEIEKDGHIYDKGIDLLSSKHQIWKGKKPDIRYPE